ncbi:hypothetical protein NQ318_022277, partial [Aromia moschata]
METMKTWEGACGVRRPDDFVNKGSVLSGFASDLDIAQQILLQNFNTPTETVFFQEPRFFGGLRHSQKEESQESSSRTDENVDRIWNLVRSDSKSIKLNVNGPNGPRRKRAYWEYKERARPVLEVSSFNS